MKSLAIAATLLVGSSTVHALDKACEPFIAAAEKAADQPARHTVSESTDGPRMEAISVDGKFYANIGGKWREMKADLSAAERKINADVRSGKIKVTDCKNLGSETVDGTPTSVTGYTIVMGDMAPAPSKIYVGKDGLPYAIASEGQRVRYRYTGVTAPKP